VKGWIINGEKMWTTGMHHANYIMTFTRTSGKPGDARGITCFIVPANSPGVKVEEYLWTFNMPTDHPRVSISNVWIPEDSYWGEIGAVAIGQASCTRTASVRRIVIGAAVLHQQHRVCTPAQTIRQAAVEQPGDQWR
jgi:alkylation response protein AidB-like acyl-CoA dehydrogenase